MPINYGTNDVATSGTVSVTGVINIDALRLDANTISSTNTNGNIILSTNGSGALQRDNQGDTRGSNAVDWQNIRSNSNMVAAGNYSVISGGANNRASGVYSAVVGGDTNEVNSSYSTITGGANNIANGNYGTILGGFRGKATRYGEVSHAAGRFASNGDAQHINLVARGLTISGPFTVDIATAVFTRSGHSLSVGDSVILSTTGGLPTGLNTTTAYYVISDGLTGSTFKLSTSAGGSSVVLSGTQSGTHSLIPSTSLTLNGAIGTQAVEYMTIPARTTWSHAINISAYSSQNNQGGSWIIWGGLRRNVNSIYELGGSSQGLAFLENAFIFNQVRVGADAVNNALDIRVSGLANQSIRWCAFIDISQVSFGTP